MSKEQVPTKPPKQKKAKVDKAKKLADYKAAQAKETALIVKTQQAELEAQKIGRPSEYTQEIGDEFCARVATGMSVRKICLADDMPAIKTIFNWFTAYPAFLQHYTRAKEMAADAWADEILDISDDGTNDTEVRTDSHGNEYEVTNHEVVARSRLRVDTRKWLAEKHRPKKYGPRLDVTSDGEKLPSPLIYIPQELPYAVISQKLKGAIDASTAEPAHENPIEKGQQNGLPSPT